MAPTLQIGLHLKDARRMRELVLLPKRRLLELRLQVRRRRGASLKLLAACSLSLPHPSVVYIRRPRWCSETQMRLPVPPSP